MMMEKLYETDPFPLVKGYFLTREAKQLHLLVVRLRSTTLHYHYIDLQSPERAL